MLRHTVELIEDQSILAAIGEGMEAGDVIDDFECRSTEQTEWLRFHARQAHAAGTAKVLVVTPVDGDHVVAYYAWSMASLSVEDAPTRVRRGAGRYPQPVALLARLVVAIEHEHGSGDRSRNSAQT